GAGPDGHVVAGAYAGEVVDAVDGRGVGQVREHAGVEAGPLRGIFWVEVDEVGARDALGRGLDGHAADLARGARVLHAVAEDHIDVAASGQRVDDQREGAGEVVATPAGQVEIDIAGARRR